MSNKKDYKIFRRTSKVLTRDIVFREVIRTLIPSMSIDENGTRLVQLTNFKIHEK